MILRKIRARPSKKSHTHKLADDNHNKEKLKVIEHNPHVMTEDYDYNDDNNIHIAVKKQRLKIGDLANNRGTNYRSAIPSMNGT